MKKIVLLACLASLLFACQDQKPEKLTSYVNPMIGTDANGHTFPGATVPYGMVQLSPDTKLSGWQGCSGYHFEDSIIYGFSHTHLSGTGCEDYCDILVLPTVGDVQWNNNDYRSTFNHKTEKAAPGYYAVTLDKYHVKAELTATARVGFHKYIFPKHEQARILFDLKHRNRVLESYVEINGNDEICGFRHTRQWAKDKKIYFAAKFSKPFDAYQMALGDSLIANHAKLNAQDIKVSFSFQTEDGEAIYVKVALSPVSIENAKMNLEAELPGWDFEAVKADADAVWEKQLSKIQVEGGSREQYVNFYTALYHATIVPNIYMDVNGQSQGRFGKIFQADYDNYTLFSLWDTYRGAHPLYTIIDSKRNQDFIKSFLKLYEQGGLLPVWELSSNETFCMIGHHAVSVIADAYMKGDRDFDVDLAYEACKKSADTNLFGLSFFRDKKYIPMSEEGESVSKTLEYAYDAWCIAQMAKDMGKADDYKEYITRAQYYKNIYDAQTGFMRAKNNDIWQTPFDPKEVNFNFTEANSWQYSFYVPHDVNGLAELHGGRDNLIALIDQMFEEESQTTGRHQSDITGLIGQYAHGNEPSHHVAYLYNYLGQPWKAQKILRRIMDDLYTATNDGLCGNEDCGQMSAWYILSAMGFYQIAPGSNHYAIGTPLFKKVTINLENGKQFVITAGKQSLRKSGKQFVMRSDGPSPKNCYIQSATLNGEDYTKSYITHADIMNGGELTFKMDSKPNKKWGTGEGNEPVSEILDYPIVPLPSITKGTQTFKKENVIEMSAVGDANIYYTLDGSKPTMQSTLYTAPIRMTESTTIRAFAEKDGQFSDEIKASFMKIPIDWTIQLENPYSSQYPAGGDEALIDFIMGTGNFRSGTWQGFYGVDMVATVDMGKVQPVREISIRFLQESYSWIFMPKSVEFLISKDGTNFKSLGLITHNVPEEPEGSIIEEFKKRLSDEARYVKVIGKYFGPLPDWHVGAGYRSWLFADEIVIK